MPRNEPRGAQGGRSGHTASAVDEACTITITAAAARVPLQRRVNLPQAFRELWRHEIRLRLVGHVPFDVAIKAAASAQGVPDELKEPFGLENGNHGPLHICAAAGHAGDLRHGPQTADPKAGSDFTHEQRIRGANGRRRLVDGCFVLHSFVAGGDQQSTASQAQRWNLFPRNVPHGSLRKLRFPHRTKKGEQKGA